MMSVKVGHEPVVLHCRKCSGVEFSIVRNGEDCFAFCLDPNCGTVITLFMGFSGQVEEKK